MAERYRRLFDDALEGIVEVGEDGLILEANPSARHMFGVDATGDLRHVQREAFVADPTSVPPLARTLCETGELRQAEVQLRRADGTTFWGSVTAQLLHGDQEGALLRLRVVDVTSRVESERALRASEARFRAVLHHTVDAIVITGADGVVQYASPSADRLLAHVLAEGRVTLGQLVPHLHPADLDVAKRIEATLAATEEAALDVELRLFDPTGATNYLQLRLLNLTADPAVRGAVWQFRDVTGQRQAELDLAHRSGHDPLTGLPNRALLEQRLEAALEQARSDGSPIGLVFIDLDRFTAVNDSLGHSSGDRLLRAIAARLGSNLRGSDLVARIGGDEFVAVLSLERRTALQPWLDEVDRASAVATRLLQEIAQPISVDGEIAVITASAGVAISTPLVQSPSEVLRDAEAALRVAQARGRNHVAIFDHDMRRRADERHRLERDLRAAVAESRLQFVFQPVADLHRGIVVGFEALLRLRGQDGRLSLPSNCLQVAEEVGLMDTINDWVLRSATSTLAQLQSDVTLRRPPELSINTTAKQVSSAHFAEQVAEALHSAGALPSGLIIEVTEHGLIEDIDACQRTLNALHDLGVRIALDDFGTGYSSLNYLQSLPFDIVKVDQSFVHALDDAPARATRLLQAIMAMAQSFGLRVVAEGVETRTQLAALLDAGCQLAQGWAIARPSELTDAVRIMRSDGLR